MITLQFNIQIQASPERVWNTLFSSPSYSVWTSVFCNGSYALTDWQTGSNYQFLNPSGDGIFGIITQHETNKKMYFTHHGEVKNLLNQEVGGEWYNMTEMYMLETNDDGCILVIEITTPEGYTSYFEEVYPKALAKVKLLSEKNYIAIETNLVCTPAQAWEVYTNTNYITKWNHASDDWHCPKAVNHLIADGTFNYTMAAKDESFSFDFVGKFLEIKEHEYLNMLLDDGRGLELIFIPTTTGTRLIEIFEPEKENTLELQEQGWQLILNNYAKVANTIL
jgi:uncharacterized protein YndB with AHSA1/START domain